MEYFNCGLILVSHMDLGEAAFGLQVVILVGWVVLVALGSPLVEPAIKYGLVVLGILCIPIMKPLLTGEALEG